MPRSSTCRPHLRTARWATPCHRYVIDSHPSSLLDPKIEQKSKKYIALGALRSWPKTYGSGSGSATLVFTLFYVSFCVETEKKVGSDLSISRKVFIWRFFMKVFSRTFEIIYSTLCTDIQVLFTIYLEYNIKEYCMLLLQACFIWEFYPDTFLGKCRFSVCQSSSRGLWL